MRQSIRLLLSSDLAAHYMCEVTLVASLLTLEAASSLRTKGVMAKDTPAATAPPEETLSTDAASFGASARGACLPMTADGKKAGGCKTHTVEPSDSVGPTVRLGGNSNQRMGAGLDPIVAARRLCRIDPTMRPTRPRTAPPSARDIYGPPSKGRRTHPKLIGPPLATVAAGPIALAMRGFRSSSPKTTVRVLVLLAMLSTASGWQLLSFEESEAPESPITGGVDGARPRRLSEDQVAFDCDPDGPTGVFSTGCTTGCAACADDEYSAASTSLVARVPWPSRQAAHARAPCRAAAPSQAVAPPRAIAHQPTVHARARRFGREAMLW